MSKPTEEELASLEECRHQGDDEGFHSDFDKVLEAKLRQLDPEWMDIMDAYYKDSNMNRWCA